MPRSLAWSALIGLALPALAWPAAPPIQPSVLTAPDGCPELPPPDTVDEADRVRSVVPEAAAPTAGENLAGGIDVAGTVEDVRRVVRTYRPVAEGRLGSTGIDVTVLSDGPVRVDLDALDELARWTLTPHPAITDARVAALLECFRRRLITDREAEGTRLRLLVASDPAACFRGGRLSSRIAVDFRDSCDALGLTLPRIDVGVRVFGMRVAGMTASALVMVAAGSHPEDPTPPNERLSRLLVHELYHHFENLLGLGPGSGSMKHYEQRAYYVERMARRQLLLDGRTAPLPLRLAGPP